NSLVHPAEKFGYVNIATGPHSSKQQPVEVPLSSAITLIRDMGGNSVKLFPLYGLQTRAKYKKIAEFCEEENFTLEPTGGINLQNFEENVTNALEAGVKKIIPQVYASIIDKNTGKTQIEDIALALHKYCCNFQA